MKSKPWSILRLHSGNYQNVDHLAINNSLIPWIFTNLKNRNYFRIDPNNREARDGLSRLDPATNRSAVHETTQAASFELVDEVEIDEEDDEQDVSIHF